MIAVAASPRVRDWLASAPDGPLPVVHRGPDAAYVEVVGRCVGLLARRAVAVPCGLRSDLEVLDVRTAHLGDGTLHVDGEPVVVGRLLDTRVPRLSAEATCAAPLPAEAASVGRGDGLTPYDDDVLCGWLAAHRAAGVATPEVDLAVIRQLHRTTLLSATLLRCALHGEVVPEYAAWLRDPDDPRTTEALAHLGHTSGRGLLAGGRLALAHLRPRQGAA